MLSLTSISKYHRRHDHILQVMRHITEYLTHNLCLLPFLQVCSGVIHGFCVAFLLLSKKLASIGWREYSHHQQQFFVGQPGQVKTGILVCSHFYLVILVVPGYMVRWVTLSPFRMNVNNDINLPAHAVRTSTDIAGYLWIASFLFILFDHAFNAWSLVTDIFSIPP